MCSVTPRTPFKSLILRARCVPPTHDRLFVATFGRIAAATVSPHTGPDIGWHVRIEILSQSDTECAMWHGAMYEHTHTQKYLTYAPTRGRTSVKYVRIRLK